MNVEEVVTGITVCHNTKELLERAYTSIRKHHPEMNIIIVDTSDRKNSCYGYVLTLRGPRTKVMHVDKNIGHGKGLCMGINGVQTPYFLIFDSDIEMFKSPISKMLEMMENDTWGVGYIERTDLGGHEWGSRKEKMQYGSMKYMHPYFCLIQYKEYKKYSTFIHHGAPATQIMLEFHKNGLSDIVLKEFPGLGHTSSSGWTWKGSPKEYIRHDTRGTRDVLKKESKGRMEIEGKWDIIKEPKIIQVSSSNVCAITCTGDRPIPFDLSLKWMKNQKIKPSQWIIVDDGFTPIKVPDLPYITYIRREPKSTDPKHTMILNMQEAIKHILGEKIIIWEDDEYYSPDYIQDISILLEKYMIVGIGRSKYYFLPGKTYYSHNNMGHASLAQTSFRKEILPEIIDVLEGDSFFDIRIWRIFNDKDVTLKETGLHERVTNDGRGFIFNDKDKSLYVGMKGMPGRRGIGSGHKGIGAKDTNNLDILHGWIPNLQDCEIYISLLENNHIETKKETNIIKNI